MPSPQPSGSTINTVARCNSILVRHWRRALLTGIVLGVITACTGNTPPTTTKLSPTHSPQVRRATSLDAPAQQGDAKAVAVAGGTIGTTIEFEDSDWSGGYRHLDDNGISGRTAMSIYGTSTPFSTIHATFTVEGRPIGTAELTVEGMDSEGADKTPIEITVNGHVIYSGPNLFPDALSLEQAAAWASYTWTFNATFLQQGQNTISISNRAEGSVDQPPFLMLDHAQLSYEEQ